MRVAVVVGSHRRNGVAEHLAQLFAAFLVRESPGSQVDTILLADVRIGPCRACRACATGKGCKVTKDDFKMILGRLAAADALVLITPRYAPVPSKVSALLERLTALSYFPAEENPAYLRPLRGKPWGLLGFDSQGTLDVELVNMLADYLEGFASGYGTLATPDAPMPPITTGSRVACNAPLEEHAAALAKMMAERLTQKEKP
jgi:NAD(P)H-dependent FMN reductase